MGKSSFPVHYVGLESMRRKVDRTERTVVGWKINSLTVSGSGGACSGQETGTAFSVNSPGWSARWFHFCSSVPTSLMMSGLPDFRMMAAIACRRAASLGMLVSSDPVLRRGEEGHFQGMSAKVAAAFRRSRASGPASWGLRSAHCQRRAAP